MCFILRLFSNFFFLLILFITLFLHCLFALLLSHFHIASVFVYIPFFLSLSSKTRAHFIFYWCFKTFNAFLNIRDQIWPEYIPFLICKNFLKVTCVGFLHNRSCISWEPNPFLSKQSVNYCLRYLSVKSSWPFWGHLKSDLAFTGLVSIKRAVNKCLYWEFQDPHFIDMWKIWEVLYVHGQERVKLYLTFEG
jgi:hypothetical protein